MKTNHKTRIGLAGIIGVGGAAAIAIGTGGAALPLILISATGFAMKKIASEPGYEPTHENELSISNIPRNIGYSLNKVLNADNKRRHYNVGLEQGASIIRRQLANLPQDKYENVKNINIFPEAREKILGLPIGGKSLEVEIEYE